MTDVYLNDYDRQLAVNSTLIASLMASRRALIIDRVRQHLLAAIPTGVTAVAFHIDDRMLALDHTIGGEADDLIFNLDDDLVGVRPAEVFAGWWTSRDEEGRLVVEIPTSARFVSSSGH